MLELLTGTGLAAAAGLNAYIPLLMVGLASRYVDWLSLPEGWTWLESWWVIGIIAVLFIVDAVADKIPAVDSINDWLQTIVRPASGGMVFGSGATAETVAVSDPSAFFAENQWVPIVSGVLIALAVHAAKSLVRPIANAVTGGTAAPVLSVLEDLSSVTLVVLAIVVPILVIVALVGLIVALTTLRRRLRRRRNARLAQAG